MERRERERAKNVLARVAPTIPAKIYNFIDSN